MKSLLSPLLIALALSRTLEGNCPLEFTSNIAAADFQKQDFAGVWWEYQWEKAFDDNLNYACSQWTIMEDVNQYRSFNHVHS